MEELLSIPSHSLQYLPHMVEQQVHDWVKKIE